MAKPFRGFVPRPTKGELVAAMKEQTARSANPDIAETQRNEELVQQAQTVAKDEVGPLPPLMTETPAAPAPPPAPKKDDAGAYMLGKKYAPKTDRNSETWAKITKALSEGPKTLKELSEVVKGHGDFIGYMTRGGHIVPYVQQEAKV